jgi:ABC-type dipeptide/oligopeptide/nickel transport system permease subunit
MNTAPLSDPRFHLGAGPAGALQAGPPSRLWPRLRRHRPGLAGFALVGLFALLALGAALGMLGQDWSAAGGGRWEPASAAHWFGTNVLGQDIFQRSVYSVGIAFEIGLIVALASTLLGAACGAVAGWRTGGWADSLVVFVTGVLDSIPFYLFVAAVAFALKGNAWSMHIAMVATFWTTTARLVRAEVMRLRHREFVQAALAMGMPARLVLSRHVLPNTFHILLAQAAIVFIAAIKSEVILSFLGLGVQDGVSWGLMLAESTQEVLAGQFNNLLAASIPLFLLLFGFNLMVDALQDAFDPRQGTT